MNPSSSTLKDLPPNSTVGIETPPLPKFYMVLGYTAVAVPKL
jgi:hypothetical protein